MSPLTGDFWVGTLTLSSVNPDDALLDFYSSFSHGPEIDSGKSLVLFSMRLLPVPLVGASLLRGNVVNQARVRYTGRFVGNM